MKRNMKKLIGFMVFAFAMVPMLNVHAQEVTDEASLRDALAVGEEITLTADIEVTAPLYAAANATVNGQGHKIYATSNFTNDGSNGSILAVTSDAQVLLQNITFEGARKYGVQAYDGGIVMLDGVTIKDSLYGALLLNGGGAAIFDFTMENNAYGIEFGKGASVNNEPALLMAGTIHGTQNEMLVLAENDNLGEVTVGNLDNSEMKLSVDGKKLVLKDQDGNVIATSNETQKDIVVKEEEIPSETPEPTPEPTPDTTVTENPNTNDSVMSYVVLAILGIGALGISSKKLLSE